MALPVTAQQVPNEGCYARTYSKAHLAENPNQGVASIRMRVFQPSGNPDPLVAMAVTMSNQGQAQTDRVMGQVLMQNLYCQNFSDSYGCGVECDGGWIEITRQSADGLTFRTDHLTIGEREECGGYSNLAEPGSGYTSYRLNAVPAAQCDGLGH